MRKINLFIILTLTIFISGCVTTSLPGNRSLDAPRFEASEYFVTRKAKMSFDIVRGQTVSRYEVLLGVRRPFEKKTFLKVEFQNPGDRKKPIVRYRELFSNEREVFLKSPPIKGRESYTNYEVVVTLYADKDLKIRLGQHKQRVRSLMEDSI